MKKVLIGMIVAIVLCLTTPIAKGIVISDEEFTVDPDKWQALALSGSQGGILQIDVEVLTEYAQVDVLIMNEYNWYRYNTTDENKQFDYYLESQLNTRSTSFTFTAPENDVYYIVIDNSMWPKTPENPENGAYMTFPVNVHVTVSDVTPLTGTVSGTVKDVDGNPVSNASVTVYYIDGTVAGTTTSDVNGNYEIELKSDTYDIKVEKSGFETRWEKDVDVITSDVTILDVMLTKAGMISSSSEKSIFMQLWFLGILIVAIVVVTVIVVIIILRSGKG